MLCAKFVLITTFHVSRKACSALLSRAQVSSGMGTSWVISVSALVFLSACGLETVSVFAVHGARSAPASSATRDACETSSTVLATIA